MSTGVSRRSYLKYAGAAVVVGAVAAASYGVYEMSKPTVTPSPTPTQTPTPTPTPTLMKPSIGVYAYATKDVVLFWDPSENSAHSNEVVVMKMSTNNWFGTTLFKTSMWQFYRAVGKSLRTD